MSTAILRVFLLNTRFLEKPRSLLTDVHWRFWPYFAHTPPPSILSAVALPLSCTEREVSCARYPALVALASLAPSLPLRLYRSRLATLRRVGHRTSPQRRGAHRHPVPARPRPTRRLEGPGDLRRNRP